MSNMGKISSPKTKPTLKKGIDGLFKAFVSLWFLHMEVLQTYYVLLLKQSRINHICPAPLMLSCPSASKHRACKPSLGLLFSWLLPGCSQLPLDYDLQPTLPFECWDKSLLYIHGMASHLISVLFSMMLFLSARSVPDDKRTLKSTKSHLSPLQRKSTTRRSLYDRKNLFISVAICIIKHDNDL